MADYNFKGLMDGTDDKTSNTQQQKPKGQYDFTGLMDDNVKSASAKKIKPDLYEKLNANVTPEMETTNPYLSGLTKTLQEGIGTPALHFANMYAGGLPAMAMETHGTKLPQPETLSGQILTGGANIAGFMSGLPMKAGKAIASKAIAPVAKGAGLLSDIAKGASIGATEFGVGSALTLPSKVEQATNLKSMAMRGLGGAAVGGVTGGVGGGINHFVKLLSEKSLLNTGKSIRGSFSKFKKAMTDNFEKAIYKNTLKNPGTKVDIKRNIENMSRQLQDSRKLKSLMNVSPKLKKAVNSEGKLSLKQTQDLINELKSTVSEAKLAGRGIRPTDKDVLDFVKSIQETKHLTFPNMKRIDAQYGVMSDYAKSIQDIMKYGKTINGLKSLFKNPERAKALKTVMPKEMFDIAKQTATAQYLGTEGFRALDYLIRYGIMYSFVRNIGGKIKGIDGGGEMTPQSGG